MNHEAADVMETSPSVSKRRKVSATYVKHVQQQARNQNLTKNLIASTDSRGFDFMFRSVDDDEFSSGTPSQDSESSESSREFSVDSSDGENLHSRVHRSDSAFDDPPSPTTCGLDAIDLIPSTGDFLERGSAKLTAGVGHKDSFTLLKTDKAAEKVKRRDSCRSAASDAGYVSETDNISLKDGTSQDVFNDERENNCKHFTGESFPGIENKTLEIVYEKDPPVSSPIIPVKMPGVSGFLSTHSELHTKSKNAEKVTKSDHLLFRNASNWDELKQSTDERNSASHSIDPFHDQSGLHITTDKYCKRYRDHIASLHNAEKIVSSTHPDPRPTKINRNTFTKNCNSLGTAIKNKIGKVLKRSDHSKGLDNGSLNRQEDNEASKQQNAPRSKGRHVGLKSQRLICDTRPSEKELEKNIKKISIAASGVEEEVKIATGGAALGDRSSADGSRGVDGPSYRVVIWAPHRPNVPCCQEVPCCCSHVPRPIPRWVKCILLIKVRLFVQYI